MMSVTTPHLLKRRVAVAAALLCACLAVPAAQADEAPGAAGAQPVLPAPLPGRAAVSRSGEAPAVAALQRRLDMAAVPPAACESDYQTYKAQAWLDFARYALQNQVPARVSTAALEAAAALVTDVEGNAPITGRSVELPGSLHLRDDLWRLVESVKHDGRLCAAPKMTAYCEVELAWMGHEAGAGGWRHTDPYVRIAEDYCATAAAAPPMAFRARFARSAPRPPDAPIALAALEMPAIGPAMPSYEMPAVAERIDLSMFVLFPHDRWERDAIRPAGRAALAELARHLGTLPPDVRITMVGHADLTGQAGYNKALSARRVHSVELELEAQGVAPARMRGAAVGSREPVVRCIPAAGAARAKYLACLEPNRRVVVRLMDDDAGDAPPARRVAAE